MIVKGVCVIGDYFIVDIFHGGSMDIRAEWVRNAQRWRLGGSSYIDRS